MAAATLSTMPATPEAGGGELASAVAHELNNALLVIRGYSSLLSGTLDDPQQRADVAEITTAADRAAQLTRRLLALASPPEPARGVDAALERGSETILVVEDEKPVRELVRHVLESAGYMVLTASRPSEADRLLDEAPEIDLLLTDIVMPEMSGYELAARVVAARPGIRTLFTSGYAAGAADAARHARGHLLKKPFAPNELAQAVRVVLDRPIADPLIS